MLQQTRMCNKFLCFVRNENAVSSWTKLVGTSSLSTSINWELTWPTRGLCFMDTDHDCCRSNIFSYRDIVLYSHRVSLLHWCWLRPQRPGKNRRCMFTIATQLSSFCCRLVLKLFVSRSCVFTAFLESSSSHFMKALILWVVAARKSPVQKCYKGRKRQGFPDSATERLNLSALIDAYSLSHHFLSDYHILHHQMMMRRQQQARR